MPLCFLTDVPREIRDHIYTFVLASPSGTVNLSPWTIEVARSLSILRTCHQVRRECKDIIWAHAGLAVHSFTQFSEKLERARQLERGFVEHIKVCLELLDWDELDWIAKSVQPLMNWAPGHLKSITLSASWDNPCGLEEFKQILKLRKSGQNIDGRLILRTVMGSSIVYHTGWPRFTHWGKQRWLREMLLAPNGTDGVLRDLHAMFGGKLYLDGRLCFSDGEQTANIVNLLNPRDGQIIILPASSKDASAWLERYE